MKASEYLFQKTNSSTNFGQTPIDSGLVDYNLPPQTYSSLTKLDYEAIAKNLKTIEKKGEHSS